MGWHAGIIFIADKLRERRNKPIAQWIKPNPLDEQNATRQDPLFTKSHQFLRKHR